MEGLAIAWLDFELLTERREKALQLAPDRGSPPIRQTEAD
jgi:hypothetical protein